MANAALPSKEVQKGKTLLVQGEKLIQRLAADSAYLAFSEAATLLKDKSPSDYMLARIGLATSLLQMKATFTCYQQMQEDERFLMKHVKPTDEAYSQFYRLKGELHFSNREVENALAAWYQARRLTIKKHGKNSLEAARVYADLSKCYFAGGRTDSSFMYVSKALQIVNKQAEPLRTEGAPIIYSLYGMHFRSFQFEEKDKFKKEVVYKGKKYPTNTHVNLAYQDSAEQAVLNLYGKDNQYLAKVYTNKAFAYSELASITEDVELRRELITTKVIPYLKKGIGIYKKYHNPEIAYLYVSLAGTYSESLILNKKLSEENILLALKACLPGYKGTNLYQVPALTNIQSENHLGLILEHVSYYFLGQYYASKDLKDLETFNQYGLKSLELAEFIRKKKAIYANENDAPAILFQNWNYGLSIESAHMLYEKTGNEKYKQQAFRNIEKLKNANLLHAALGYQLANTLQNYDNLDKNLKRLTAKTLREEEQTEIARRFASLRNKSPFRNAKTQLASTRQEMQQLASEAKTKYPAFYGARIEQNNALSIEEVQKRLPDNKTAKISYFLNVNYAFDREVYMLVVQKKRTDFIRTTLPQDYELKIDSLVHSITNSDLPVYRKLASQFHELLVKPADKVLGKQVEKLMIMPDGYLWQIPFETLLTNQTASSDYRKLPYLLNKYHISYQHSSTLNKLSKELTRAQDQKFEKPILAMAPFADKSLAGQIASGKINLMGGEMIAGTYAKLPYTIDLLLKLQQKVKGMFLIDKEATEEYFKSHASNFSIIHLATHAETDMANPLNSKFLMAKGETEDGELHMSELLNLNIRPNLAVLSACETGKGMIDNRNDAMTSLSWGFYYLGCPSTLSTLWKVDDRQTSTVLSSFYEYLFAGKTKQEALQQAKVDFISKARNSEEANPFYWSGLVLTGDEGPLPVGLEPWWKQTWFLATAMMLAALAGWLIWKKQRSAGKLQKQFA
ncbi:CHAT domain-containing protein [Adhaeribacter terreus]|uniref:CHAT domain-containing protein n=1 Tax=Adhaeribacter terreus TaxID=529703 RepID=A0ABW0EA66_9BACT